MDTEIDKILYIAEAASALQEWGLAITVDQIRRAARRPPGILSIRKIPFMVCSVSGKLVIRESALRAWLDSTYPSSPVPASPGVAPASTLPAPAPAQSAPQPPQPPQVRPTLARADRPADRKPPNYQIASVTRDQKVFPLGTSKRL